MDKCIYKFFVIAMFTLGSGMARCETTNATLTFYIVSEQKNDGGRFIDVPNLLKVGYISAIPDLVLTNLSDVYREKMPSSAIVNGKRETSHPLPALSIHFRPDDKKRFTALTEKALDKRLLVILDNKPLTAPKVMVPVDGAYGFLIEFANESELEKTQAELMKLVTAR